MTIGCHTYTVYMCFVSLIAGYVLYIGALMDEKLKEQRPGKQLNVLAVDMEKTFLQGFILP